MSTTLDWARRYRQLGYHPIPVIPGQKRPSVDWKLYQDIAPSDDVITRWWSDSPKSGIALVMGRGTFAVDLDGGDDAEALLREAGVTLPADAPRSRTGGGGYHVLLRGQVPDAVALCKDETRAHCQVDLRGKGIIVAPPSIHPSGVPYRWDVPPGRADALPPASDALLHLIHTPLSAPVAVDAPSGSGWVAEALHGVGQGTRADTCVRLAGYFLGRGLPRETVTVLLQTGFAPRCVPPFPDTEVASTVASIAQRETATGDGPHAVDPQHISTILDELETQRAAGPAPSVPTGFEDLDWDLTGGFHPGDLIYLGARPGVGKTALALQIAYHAAANGHPVLMVSREMVNTALARRMMSQVARVPARALRGGILVPSEARAYDDARLAARCLPLWFTDQLVSITDLVALMTTFEVANATKTGLIIVDYLQLLRAPAEVRERRLQIEAVSATLKTLALQYRTPILCLSSLSRPPQATPDAKPTLASLRESGELEHDADVVMFLHRGMQESETTLIMAKNREGQTGHRDFVFTPEVLTFRAVAKQEGNRS